LYSTSPDSINYDEYLDAGIPDTLLEGLGFYASSGNAEASPDTEEMADERPVSSTAAEELQSLTAASSTNAGKFQSLSVLYCIKTAKRRITQIMPHNSPLTLVF